MYPACVYTIDTFKSYNLNNNRYYMTYHWKHIVEVDTLREIQDLFYPLSHHLKMEHRSYVKYGWCDPSDTLDHMFIKH